MSKGLGSHHVKLDFRSWQNLPEWRNLPEFMQQKEVKPYYDVLNKRKMQLKFKRLFDVTVAFVLTGLLAIPMGIIAIVIKMDSPGPIFYRQERVTTYGTMFRIHKFRTMIENADEIGSAVTISGDERITKIGEKLRRFRLDELPQLLDVLEGNMSFVGTRPEAVKYVMRYSPEMLATLLMPAGITSEASIRYKNEAKLLNKAYDVDSAYIEKILPEKMKWNLKSIKEFCLIGDIVTMLRTVAAVLGKDYG